MRCSAEFDYHGDVIRGSFSPPFLCIDLGRYATLEIVRIKESGALAERDAIFARLQPNERVVVFDERGDQVTTEELARRLARWQRDGTARMAFVIGGADGVHAEVKARAGSLLALSRLTLPHRLALVVALEQLYRAHTLLRGEPYHRT